MANNAKAKATAAVEESIVEPVAKRPAPAESVYTAAELADNYRKFNTFREVVIVALRKAGKETATLAEAKEIIEKFKTKEVK